MIIIPGSKKNLAVRYYANVIDYLIYFIIIGISIFALGTENDEGGYSLKGFKALIIPFLWFLYFPLCESLFKQTLGKKAFSLYVVDLRGESADVVRTFLRRSLDFFEMSFLGIPSLLSINASETNRRIGDRIAGTTVILTMAFCRFCAVQLELSTREVMRGSFMCPVCKKTN